VTKYKSLSVVALGIVVATFAAPVSAAIVSADFNASFDLPDANFGLGPRVFEALGRGLGAGDELTDADEIQNPSGWGGGAFIDISSTGLITLTGSQPFGFADYDLASFTISNISFDAGDFISGFSTLTQGLLDPNFGIGVFAPAIVFGTNSISFLFDTTGSGDLSDFQFSDGGTSTYQLTLAVVPLPAALPLLLVALGGLGFAARRRKTA